MSSSKQLTPWPRFVESPPPSPAGQGSRPGTGWREVAMKVRPLSADRTSVGGLAEAGLVDVDVGHHSSASKKMP